ncbi:MAG TPA: DUF2249 domain-containing protein [Dehalococcoidia bacterium]
MELDNRGLEPPEPMMRILARLADLPQGAVLLARNDREPLFLYPILDEDGYRHEAEPQPDGTYLVRIWKEAGPC